MTKKILFLGYKKNQTKLIDELKKLKNVKLFQSNKFK